MGWFEAIVLGLIQGLTRIPADLVECAPAHHRRAGGVGRSRRRVHRRDLYFSKKIGQILAAWFFSLYKKDWRGHAAARLGWLIIVGSVPIIVLGLLFQAGVDHTFRDLRLTATMLIVFGIILLPVP